MTKSKKKDKPAQKLTLVELVQSSKLHYPLIIMNLSRAGLLKQYEEELNAQGRLDIQPTLTQNEFNKIMED